MDREQTNFRIDAEAKRQAYQVLRQIGIKPTDVVNMLMHHIAMFKELPFKPGLPNSETLKTFRDTDAGIGLTRHNDIDSIFSNIHN